MIDFVVANAKSDIQACSRDRCLYLELAGIVLGGWQMARAACIADRQLDDGIGDADFLRAKLATARFFADHLLSRAPGLRESIVLGGEAVMELEEAQF